MFLPHNLEKINGHVKVSSGRIFMSTIISTEDATLALDFYTQKGVNGGIVAEARVSKLIGGARVYKHGNYRRTFPAMAGPASKANLRQVHYRMIYELALEICGQANAIHFGENYGKPEL